ncbi:MAG: malonyl-CoA O-methyltransferase [Lentimonas sp.]|jgi:malonyl-CoA O-methyltransferase
MNRNPEHSRASFGKKAGNYEAHAFVQSDAAAWLAEWILPLKYTRCLELGAGTGLLTRHLEGKFEHLECSDIEPAMVALCQSKFPAVTHRVRDAWQKQPDTGKWDLVTASSVLQWANDPKAVMQNWRELLRPDGKIIAGFFVKPSLPEMHEVTGGKSPLIWRDVPTWKAIFESTGLQVERIEDKTTRYYYKSALDFWKSIHGTGAAVSRKISPSQMMRFFRDYESKFCDKDGVYATWTFCRVELMLCLN